MGLPSKLAYCLCTYIGISQHMISFYVKSDFSFLFINDNYEKAEKRMLAWAYVEGRFHRAHELHKLTADVNIVKK